MTNIWINRLLEEAKHKSSWSKDPSRKIGAVAVGEFNQIISTGYNGFPRGINDDISRYSDREIKYKYVVHAEMNLIYNACLTGVSLNKSKLFVYGLPVCSECAKGIIQVGVKEIHCMIPNNCPDIWKESSKLSKSMFSEAGIIYKEYEEIE